MLFPTFLEKNSGNKKKNILRKTIISHFMFSSCFMLFPTSKKNSVGGRSRATELSCLNDIAHI